MHVQGKEDEFFMKYFVNFVILKNYVKIFYFFQHKLATFELIIKCHTNYIPLYEFPSWLLSISKLAIIIIWFERKFVFSMQKVAFKVNRITFSIVFLTLKNTMLFCLSYNIFLHFKFSSFLFL